MNTEKFIKDTLSKVYELLMKETPVLHETEEAFMEVIINNFAQPDDHSMLEALGLNFPLFDEEKLVLSQDIEMWDNLLKSVPDETLPAFALMEEIISQEAFDEEGRPFFNAEKAAFLNELIEKNTQCLSFMRPHRHARVTTRKTESKNFTSPQSAAFKLYLETFHDFKINAATLRTADRELSKKSEEYCLEYTKILKEFKALAYSGKMEVLLSTKMLGLSTLLNKLFDDFQNILPEIITHSGDFSRTLEGLISEFDMSTVENAEFYFKLGAQDLATMRHDPLAWILKTTSSPNLAFKVPGDAITELNKLLIAKYAPEEDILLKGSEEERYTWLLIQFLNGVPDKDTQVRNVYHSLPKALKILTLRGDIAAQMNYFNNILIGN